MMCNNYAYQLFWGLLKDVTNARWGQQWVFRVIGDFLIHDDDWQLCVNQVKWACVHTLVPTVGVSDGTVCTHTNILAIIIIHIMV